MSKKLTSLRLVESLIEDLENLIEEAQITSTDLDKSTPHEIKALSIKILAHLTKDDDEKSYDELIGKYNSLVSTYPELKPYQREEKPQKQCRTPKSLETGKKSVRFNDNLDVQPFKPFSDNDPSNSSSVTSDRQVPNQGTPLLFEHAEDSDSENENLMSNTDIFVTHQQTQLTQQDAHLQTLAESVKRSHNLGLDIHGELTEQNFMLNDLEAQLEGTDLKLQRAKRGLGKFTEIAKHNTEWFTILCLFVILLLLLVVL